MENLPEAAANRLSPAQFRCKQAECMLDLYVESKGEAYDSYFDMNCFLDAFLFMLVSVEDIAPPNVSANFRKEPAFVFLKQLRNLTTHHAIAAGSIQGSKFLRPLSRDSLREWRRWAALLQSWSARKGVRRNGSGTSSFQANTRASQGLRRHGISRWITGLCRGYLPTSTQSRLGGAALSEHPPICCYPAVTKKPAQGRLLVTH